MLDGDPIQSIDLQVITIRSYLVLFPGFGIQDPKLWMLSHVAGGMKVTDLPSNLPHSKSLMAGSQGSMKKNYFVWIFSFSL